MWAHVTIFPRARTYVYILPGYLSREFQDSDNSSENGNLTDILTETEFSANESWAISQTNRYK